MSKKNKSVAKNRIDFSVVIDLRKAADALKLEQPHLPLLLELVILGLGRTSIAKLKIDSIKDNIVYWNNRSNVKLNKSLSIKQIAILDEYLRWRRSKKSVSDNLFLVQCKTRLNNNANYFLPMKIERPRNDIAMLGKAIGLDFRLEMGEIRRSVIDYLLVNGVNRDKIKNMYKNEDI